MGTNTEEMTDRISSLLIPQQQLSQLDQISTSSTSTITVIKPKNINKSNITSNDVNVNNSEEIKVEENVYSMLGMEPTIRKAPVINEKNDNDIEQVIHKNKFIYCEEELSGWAEKLEELE